MKCALITTLAVLFHAGRLTAQTSTLYDADPAHLWNRLDAVIRIRTTPTGQQFGQDSLDPLLWPKTKHLLEGESHQAAIAVLDEFSQTHAERLITDPLKRAILQRDLWACFDWSADHMTDHKEQRDALQSRLAQVIQSVALTRQQIEALPNLHAAAIDAKRFPVAFDPAKEKTPFLPIDLFDPTGPWINIAPGDKSRVAPKHDHAARGHSIFDIYLRHPDGRQAGLEYLQKLAETPPYVQDPTMRLNDKVLQFPVGTQLAMVRRTMLIDNHQQVVSTRLIESIQLRVFRRIDSDRKPFEDQAFFEFQLRRGNLFTSPAEALHAFKFGDSQVTTFGGTGDDIFEYPWRQGTKPVYTHGVLGGGCFGCHSEPGVQSMHSFARVYPYHFQSPGIISGEPNLQSELATAEKPKREDWKLFQKLSRSDNPR